MIELENVTLSKSGAKLFDNFSLKIAPGEHWVIQGANGSGKTLLLQLIAGALHPVSGYVRHHFIRGDDWDTMYQQRLKKIHFIPTHWLRDFVSGMDGMFYQQRYYSMDETELPRVREVFGDDLERLKSLEFSERFNISNLLDLPVMRLSNGQLKKVIIMRQLARNIPRFLLLDYPFDGLDAGSRLDLSSFIDELALAYEIQIVMVDHGPNLPKIINRRLILNKFRTEKIENIQRGQPVTMYENTIAPMGMGEQTQDEPIVEMKNLTIAYSGKVIISNLNWQIKRGERWALTGRNGSGKTTLFSLIYADHPMAYSQQVYLFGRRRGSGESIWDIKKRINYFGPEQIHFFNPKYLTLTGRQHILTQRGINPQRLTDLIYFFQAHHYIDQPIRQLSSGQLQMVLLLNLFLDHKELLLLDEPFQFLDPDHHAALTRFLNEYLDKDITLVLITHEERDVARWTQLRKHL